MVVCCSFFVFTIYSPRAVSALFYTQNRHIYDICIVVMRLYIMKGVEPLSSIIFSYRSLFDWIWKEGWNTVHSWSFTMSFFINLLSGRRGDTGVVSDPFVVLVQCHHIWCLKTRYANIPDVLLGCHLWVGNWIVCVSNKKLGGIGCTELSVKFWFQFYYQHLYDELRQFYLG